MIKPILVFNLIMLVVGAVVGVIAALWAAEHMSEVAEVFDRMVQADSRARELQGAMTDLKSRMGSEVRILDREERGLALLNAEIDSGRTELRRLQ